jgi:hypothetical protein
LVATDNVQTIEVEQEQTQEIYNDEIRDDLFASNQDDLTNIQAINVLTNQGDLAKIMNENGSFFVLKTPAEAFTSAGSSQFVIQKTGDIFGTIKVGGVLPDGVLGVASHKGRFINIVVDKSDIGKIKYKKQKYGFSKSDIAKLQTEGAYKDSFSDGKTIYHVLKDKNNQIIGYYDREDGKLLKWSVGLKDKASTIVHESAHMIQALKDKTLRSIGPDASIEVPKWRQIMKQNNLTINDAPTFYGRTNEFEFFAETYTAFVLDNNNFKLNEPKLYSALLDYFKLIDFDVNKIVFPK